MIRFKCLLILCVAYTTCSAQFPGAAGTLGSTAMHQDSGNFVGWADNCVAEPGYLDIADKSLGFANNGNRQSCIGKPGLNVLSLGDSGAAILTFEAPIYDGEGFDFAVFENAFSDYFLELAFVEVSSDGLNFVRFPAICNQQDTQQQGAYDEISDPTKINNLAGKYRAQFGTPFDLSDLVDSLNIDLSSITHVRIVDAIGSLEPEYAQFDHLGNAINDPYPTDFDFGGFDLNAVGVIHQHPLSIKDAAAKNQLVLPNPMKCNSSFHLIDSEINKITIIDMLGKTQLIEQINQSFTAPKTPGNYMIQFEGNGHISHQKIVLIP
jgi:hypothetical protein